MVTGLVLTMHLNRNAFFILRSRILKVVHCINEISGAGGPFGFKIYLSKLYGIFMHEQISIQRQFEWPLYSTFNVTWTTFKFNRNRLGTVSAYVMSSVPWSNKRAIISLEKNYSPKNFTAGQRTTS